MKKLPSLLTVAAIATYPASASADTGPVVEGAGSACIYVQGSAVRDSVIKLEFTPKGRRAIVLELSIEAGETARRVTSRMETALVNVAPGYILYSDDEAVCISRYCRVPRFSLKVTHAGDSPALCLEGHESRGRRAASTCERFGQADRQIMRPRTFP